MESGQTGRLFQSSPLHLMTSPSNPQSGTPDVVRPYAMVTIFGDAGSHRLDFNGELVAYYTTWEGDIELSPNRFADLLNDAHAKGVEAERARVAALMAEGDQSGAFADERVDYRQQAINLLIATYAFAPIIADRLVIHGICSPAAFEGVLARDLVDIGFTQEEADDVMRQVNPQGDF